MEISVDVFFLYAVVAGVVGSGVIVGLRELATWHRHRELRRQIERMKRPPGRP